MRSAEFYAVAVERLRAYTALSFRDVLPLILHNRSAMGRPRLRRWHGQQIPGFAACISNLSLRPFHGIFGIFQGPFEHLSVSSAKPSGKSGRCPLIHHALHKTIDFFAEIRGLVHARQLETGESSL